MPDVVTTKTGDKGTTSLYSGQRVSKSSERVESYGTVDEINSWLGLIRSALVNNELIEIIYKIQQKLFVVGAELATIDKDLDKRMTKEDVEYLEEKIEYYKDHSDLIDEFTIPGRSKLDGYFNVARTVTRRAERQIIRFREREEVEINKYLVKYINRLSDLMYIVSRLDFTKYNK
ncbi:MAG: cob(I)yrinic acid a,c-diamide adenosyltransferase [Bacillota bacterium]